MHIKNLEQNYTNAKLAFKNCVLDQGNDFLANEVDIPINSIKLIEESIKIVYEKTNTENYIIETKIQLISQSDDVIGSYIYYENEKGFAIDDRLIFL